MAQSQPGWLGSGQWANGVAVSAVNRCPSAPPPPPPAAAVEEGRPAAGGSRSVGPGGSRQTVGALARLPSQAGLQRRLSVGRGRRAAEWVWPGSGSSDTL